jgi:flagellar hook-associated protein 3 FlgL
MRVNPDMSSDILSAIWETQDQENTALQQISTGKRVNVPSDDPLAAAQMVGNQDQTNRADQYLQNIDTLTSSCRLRIRHLALRFKRLLKALPLGYRDLPELCHRQTASRSCKT